MALSLKHPENDAYKGALSIITHLTASGHIAYLAGGCVRDMVMDIPPADYDIATDAAPDRISQLFTNAQEVGKAFGVMLVAALGHSYEVATFRTDHDYVDGRHPETIRFATPQEDAHRRDFTINALFYDPLKDRLHDYVNGLDDIAAGLVRAVGCAEERFTEDHLRMLRAVRFTARFSFSIDAKTLDAIRTNAPRMSRISKERITSELNKICSGPHPGAGLSLLASCDLWQVIFNTPPPIHIKRLESLLEQLAPLSPSAVYASILNELNSTVSLLRDSLRLSKKILKEIDGTHRCFHKLHNWDQLQPADRRRLVAENPFTDAFTLFEVVEAESMLPADVHTYLESLPSPPALPQALITGRDLISAGLKQGPGFSALLEAVFNIQITQPQVSREELLHRALSLSKETNI